MDKTYTQVEIVELLDQQIKVVLKEVSHRINTGSDLENVHWRHCNLLREVDLDLGFDEQTASKGKG